MRLRALAVALALLAVAGPPAGAATTATRVAVAAGVTPSGLLVASTRIAIEGAEGPAEGVATVWLGADGKLGTVEVAEQGVAYAPGDVGRRASRTFAVVRDGERAAIRWWYVGEGGEREFSITWDARGVVRRGRRGALVRVEPWGPGQPLAADRVSVHLDVGFGEAPTLATARAVGSDLDSFDGRSADAVLRGLAPGETLALEALTVPGFLPADAPDAARLAGPLPPWTARPPRVVVDDEEVLPEPATGSTPGTTLPEATVASTLPPLTIEAPTITVGPIDVDLDAPEDGTGGLPVPAWAIAAIVGAFVVAVAGLRSRRRRPPPLLGSQPAPPAPPTPPQVDGDAPTGRHR